METKEESLNVDLNNGSYVKTASDGTGNTNLLLDEVGQYVDPNSFIQAVPNNIQGNGLILHWANAGGATTSYGTQIIDFSEPTLEGLKNKMEKLEEMMAHLKKQMIALGEGGKKYEKRKLGQSN